MERNYDKSQEWWNSLPMYNMDKPCKRVLAARYYQTEQSFLTNVQIEMIFINECQQPNNDEVKKKYSSVIAVIYLNITFHLLLILKNTTMV